MRARAPDLCKLTGDAHSSPTELLDTAEQLPPFPQYAPHPAQTDALYQPAGASNATLIQASHRRELGKGLIKGYADHGTSSK